jgi:hypothetical protein
MERTIAPSVNVGSRPIRSESQPQKILEIKETIPTMARKKAAAIRSMPLSTRNLTEWVTIR